MEVFGGEDEEGCLGQGKQHREVSDKGFLCHPCECRQYLGRSVLPGRFKNPKSHFDHRVGQIWGGAVAGTQLVQLKSIALELNKTV